MALETHEFESGLKVAVEQVPTAHTTAVNVMVKVGGLNEAEDEAGLSHLLEHCVHKQTDLYSSNDNRLEYEQAYQYSSFANTSLSRTMYGARGPKFDPMIRGLAATICTPALKDEHIAEEVAVVTREAKMNLDKPDARMYFAALQHVFSPPYSRPVIGYWQNLAFDGEEVREYYHREYSLGKIAIIATGKASIEEVVLATDKYFESSPLANKTTADPQPQKHSLPPLIIGEPGIYGINTEQHSNVSLESGHPLIEELKAKFLSPARFAYYTAAQFIGSAVAKSLRDDRQLSYDGGYWVNTNNTPEIWTAGANVTCDSEKIDEAIAAFDYGVEKAALVKPGSLRIRNSVLAAQGAALISVDDIGAACASITGAIEYGVEPLSREKFVSAYKKMRPADVAEAIQHLAEEYKNSEKFTFIGGDSETIKSYPLLEPKL